MIKYNTNQITTRKLGERVTVENEEMMVVNCESKVFEMISK